MILQMELQIIAICKSREEFAEKNVEIVPILAVEKCTKKHFELLHFNEKNFFPV